MSASSLRCVPGDAYPIEIAFEFCFCDRHCMRHMSALVRLYVAISITTMKRDPQKYLSFPLPDDGTYAVDGFAENKVKDLVIPATHNGVAVTAISKNAFYEEPYRNPFRNAVMSDIENAGTTGSAPRKIPRRACCLETKLFYDFFPAVGIGRGPVLNARDRIVEHLCDCPHLPAADRIISVAVADESDG